MIVSSDGKKSKCSLVILKKESHYAKKALFMKFEVALNLKIMFFFI